MMETILLFLKQHWQEILGVTIGTMQPILATRNNPNNYLFGIAAILLSMWVFVSNKLYADFMLNMYYLVMSIYGWIYWKFGKNKSETPITTCSKTDYLKVISIIVGCFFLMTYVLKNHTDSDVPIWDSAVSAFAWGGMWLMAKRKLENWIALNVSNLLAIPLLFHKSLYVYSAHTVFLFIVGSIGFINWLKILKNERLNSFSNDLETIGSSTK